MTGNEAGTRKYWGTSLFLHVGVLVFLVVRPGLFFHPARVIEQGKDTQQQVIQATVVQEPLPVKRVMTAVSAPPPQPAPRPMPLPAPRPVVFQKQLLADLKKDISRQKARQKALQQHKILNAKALQKQLLQEKIRAEGERSARMRGVVDHYRALILQVISQNWRLPGIPDKHLSAELLIHLAPGGTVLDVQVLRGSGNVALDGSARTAVFRSSPLPVPSNRDEFEPFRSFVLKVVPEELLASS